MGFPIFFVGGPWHGNSDRVEKPPLLFIRIITADREKLKAPSVSKYAREDYRFNEKLYRSIRWRSKDRILTVYIFEDWTDDEATAFLRTGRLPERLQPKPAAKPVLTALQEYDRQQPDFVELLKSLLVAEYGKSEDEAAALVKTHTSIVIYGIMAWNLRATAMALEMAEEEAASVT